MDMQKILTDHQRGLELQEEARRLSAEAMKKHMEGMGLMSGYSTYLQSRYFQTEVCRILSKEPQKNPVNERIDDHLSFGSGNLGPACGMLHNASYKEV